MSPSKKSPLCPICRERATDFTACDECWSAYDRAGVCNGAITTIVKWAAERAWKFATKARKT